MLTQPGLEQSNLARESPESGHFIQRKVTTEPPISPAVIGLSWLITWSLFPISNVYGHITLNTPVLVRSLKLSKVETC